MNGCHENKKINISEKKPYGRVQSPTFNLLRMLLQYIWKPSYDIGNKACVTRITRVTPCRICFKWKFVVNKENFTLFLLKNLKWKIISKSWGCINTAMGRGMGGKFAKRKHPLSQRTKYSTIILGEILHPKNWC